MCGSKLFETFKFPALSCLIGLFEQKHPTIGLFKKFTGNLAESEGCVSPNIARFANYRMVSFSSFWIPSVNWIPTLCSLLVYNLITGLWPSCSTPSQRLCMPCSKKYLYMYLYVQNFLHHHHQSFPVYEINKNWFSSV